MMKTFELPPGMTILADVTDEQAEILSPAALEFFAILHREFNPRRLQLLRQRRHRQAAIDRGQLPGFLSETEFMRESAWHVLPVPDDLKDRRVEITGPVDRKMVINALNSGANCYMADFEDAHSPTWEGTLAGQRNLRDAVRGNIEYTSPEGKRYQLNRQVATLLMRPRGWHLPEQHILVDGEAASASLFDFAIYFFYNARYRALHDSGLYLYLPKLEHHLEARLWNDVFVRAQDLLGVPQGTVKATVLIEHILAAFQMEEILYELRHHSAGLNCGRWDYLFSYIKTFARRENCLVPDRAQVTMTAPFMRAYSLACIKTCHRRGTFAIGGMAAYIPVKDDAAANEQALQKVREDKRREATDGHDGTWVAHPGLVTIARAEFDRVLHGQPNQISRRRDDVSVTPQQLLEVPRGTITEAGLRTNIRVGIRYLEAWLGGLGCVPLYNLMEDAATAEISRTQVWQWVHHPHAVLDDGRKITLPLVRDFMAQELERIHGEGVKDSPRLELATRLFDELVADDELAEFLTLKAYALLDAPNHVAPRRNRRSARAKSSRGNDLRLSPDASFRFRMPPGFSLESSPGREAAENGKTNHTINQRSINQ
jgi:malate synthase